MKVDHTTLDMPPKKSQDKTDSLARRVGDNIRNIRKSRDMKLGDLAKLCGTTAQTIQRLETTQMTLSINWIEQICNALDFHPRDLFDPPPRLSVAKDPTVQKYRKIILEINKSQ